LNLLKINKDHFFSIQLQDITKFAIQQREQDNGAQTTRCVTGIENDPVRSDTQHVSSCVRTHSA